MDAIMLTANTYNSALPGCKPGEEVEIQIAKEGEPIATFRGKVVANEDGTYSIPIGEGASDDGEVPVKNSKAKAVVEEKSKPRKMSKAASAVMEDDGY